MKKGFNVSANSIDSDQPLHADLSGNILLLVNFVHVNGQSTSWFRQLYDKMDFMDPYSFPTQSRPLMTLQKNLLENIVGKGENAGNQHFLLVP